MPRIGPSTQQGGKGNKAEIVPPGQYVVALVWFKRKQTERGSDYLSCLFEICGGQLLGKTFFANLSLDLTREGTVKRWQVYMGVLGITEQIEMGSTEEGSEDEGNANIRRLFVGRPFAAEVALQNDGQYRNNDIKAVIFRSKWTPAWTEIAKEWLARKLAGGDPEEYAGDPPAPEPDDQTDPHDKYGPPARGGGNYDEDDEIPF